MAAAAVGSGFDEHDLFRVRGGSPTGRFEVFFQPGKVGRHLLLGFAADEQGDEEFADAMAFEVDGDGQPGPGLGEWFDGEVDRGPDRSVNPVDAPRFWVGRYA
jgi:hypothetical protein